MRRYRKNGALNSVSPYASIPEFSRLGDIEDDRAKLAEQYSAGLLTAEEYLSKDDALSKPKSATAPTWLSTIIKTGTEIVGGQIAAKQKAEILEQQRALVAEQAKLAQAQQREYTAPRGTFDIAGISIDPKMLALGAAALGAAYYLSKKRGGKKRRRR